jgi:hypothetical protein
MPESDCDLEYDNQEDVNMDEVAEWRHKCAGTTDRNFGSISKGIVCRYDKSIE